jgi:uncharacterized RDD family membrane protein YckC
LCDAAVLALVGAILGTTESEFFSSIGEWGRLVGLAISVVYFTWAIGPFGEGQTIGLTWQKIRVVSRDSKAVSGKKALIRALVLCPLLVLNGFVIQATTAVALVVGLIFGALVVLTLANLYFCLFNRRDGRALHDIIAGTALVDLRQPCPPPVGPPWRGHFVILGLLGGALVLMIAVGGILVSGLLKPALQEPMAIARSLGDMPGLRVRTVMEGVNYNWINGHKSQVRYLQIGVASIKYPEDRRAIADRVVSRAVRAAPGISRFDVYAVEVGWGYTLGIWSWPVSTTYSLPPNQWPTDSSVSALRFRPSHRYLWDRSCLDCAWSPSISPTVGG